MSDANTRDTQIHAYAQSHDHRFSDKKAAASWVKHPIDIRISLPFVHKRFYFTVVAGSERRPADRLQQDRAAYPLITAGNVMFSLGVTTLLVMAALTVLIAQSAIIE